jgi:hypothetical protein
MWQDIKFYVLGLAIVLPLAVAVSAWKYNTCIDEGLSKTYCLQRAFLR